MRSPLSWIDLDWRTGVIVCAYGMRRSAGSHLAGCRASQRAVASGEWLVRGRRRSRGLALATKGNGGLLAGKSPREVMALCAVFLCQQKALRRRGILRCAQDYCDRKRQRRGRKKKQVPHPSALGAYRLRMTAKKSARQEKDPPLKSEGWGTRNGNCDCNGNGGLRDTTADAGARASSRNEPPLKTATIGNSESPTFESRKGGAPEKAKAGAWIRGRSRVGCFGRDGCRKSEKNCTNTSGDSIRHAFMRY
jgi:hypothetical protein